MPRPDEQPIDDRVPGDERGGTGDAAEVDDAAERVGNRVPGEHDRDGERGATVIRFPSATRPARNDPPDPRLRDLLGEVVRDERRRQGRTLADVAEAAAVSLPYLSEIERGRKEVSSDLLDAVCDALELPLIEVLERSADRLRARAQGGGGIQLRAA